MAKIKAILAGFILGFLTGAAILNLLIGNNLDKAELKINKLQSELEDSSAQVIDLEKELANVEKKLTAKQKPVVSTMDIHVLLEDEFEKLELEAEVKKLLQDIRGKDVEALDPLLITGIVNGRTLSTAARNYRMTVKGTLVSEKLIMYIEANEIE